MTIKDKFRQITMQLAPFLVLGIAIALLVGLVVMFSYVILWGILIGVCLWLVLIIKNLLFTPRSSIHPTKPRTHKGRTFDQDTK